MIYLKNLYPYHSPLLMFKSWESQFFFPIFLPPLFPMCWVPCSPALTFLIFLLTLQLSAQYFSHHQTGEGVRTDRTVVETSRIRGNRIGALVRANPALINLQLPRKRTMESQVLPPQHGIMLGFIFVSCQIHKQHWNEHLHLAFLSALSL